MDHHNSLQRDEFIFSECRGGETLNPTDERRRSPSSETERDEEKDKQDYGKRRRLVDPVTCEKDYDEEELDFIKAIDLYKRANRRPFPTWTEVLEVLRSLGYRKTEDATSLPGFDLNPKEDSRN